MFLITPPQCRAARALLGWSQPDLAGRCGMHVQTISAFESETGTPTKRTLEKIAGTLEDAGVEFLPSEGVCKKTQTVKTYAGKTALGNLLLDVLEETRKFGKEICVSNVDERVFDSYIDPEVDASYMKRMAELKKAHSYQFKILVKEGDLYFTASKYAEYRWIEPRYFHTAPFYVYGDKLALLLLDKGPTVHIVENKDIADAQRIQFNAFWENAKIPPIG